MSDCHTWKPESRRWAARSRNDSHRSRRYGTLVTNTVPSRTSAAGGGAEGLSGVPAMNATASTIVASTMAEPRSPWSEHDREQARAEHEHQRPERRPQVVHAIGAAGEQVGGVDEQHRASAPRRAGSRTGRSRTRPGRRSPARRCRGWRRRCSARRRRAGRARRAPAADAVRAARYATSSATTPRMAHIAWRAKYAQPMPPRRSASIDDADSTMTRPSMQSTKTDTAST